jgi:flagellar hook assembly protein FlgD
MKHEVRSNEKTWILVPLALALLTLMLFPAVASAKVDVQMDQLNDSVRLVVKNTGDKSTFLLNSLTVSDDSGKNVYTSQEKSSADLLNLEPGVSYAFEWDIDDVPEGNYTQKIYQGDDKRNLNAISFDFLRGKRQDKPILYTGKKFYKYGENIDIAFINMGTYTIYVNVNNWEIKNRDTGKVVFRPSQDCSFGYGGCADSFEPLRFLKTIERTWDQKDSNGNQVVPGKYDVTAEYSNKDPSSGKVKIEKITTKKFYIRPMSQAPIIRADLNGNGVSADADDLDLMKQASTGEISSDSGYDLNNNGIPADAGDLVLMKRASNGEIDLNER